MTKWNLNEKPIYSAILWHFILRQPVTKKNGQIQEAHKPSATPNIVAGAGDDSKKLNILADPRTDTVWETVKTWIAELVGRGTLRTQALPHFTDEEADH